MSPIHIFGLIVVILLFSGFPIALSFLVASTGYMLVTGQTLEIIAKQMVSGVDSFVFLAVPLFILAAQTMNESGITDKLFNFSNKLVGHIPGGLGHVNIVSSIIFSGMSGSALADTSGIGYLSYKSMTDRGFDKPFSAALTISSATVGPIIPPSIIMVIYAVIANTSVGKLFVAGIIPGLLLGLALMIYTFLIGEKKHFPREAKPSLSELLSSFLASFWPLLTPVILVGGIYSGMFTPTEASAVAAGYAILLCFFYRGVHEGVKALAKVGRATVKLTGMTMFIVATASVFSWVITRENIPQLLTTWILEMKMSKIVFLLMVNIIFFVVGCLFDTNTILLVFVPLLLPLLTPLGISPVHFGVIVVLNLMIGMMTPPFGMQLFLVSGLTGVSIKAIVRAMFPMLVSIIVVLFIITYYQPIVMWLPDLMK
jgi:tripartite ATP-independent transporter DctM subunit